MTANSDGLIELNGARYMRDAKGALVPEELVKPELKLEDQTVRNMILAAKNLSDQVTAFKQSIFSDIDAVDALLAEKYGVTKGGPKGNKQYMTHDGLMEVRVQVADYIDFGPQLQIAKELVDECLNEWSAESRPEIRALVTRAFNTDKAGQINRSEIFMLLRLDITDQRWMSAMAAIRDAMRVVGTKTFVRFYERDTPDGGWRTITIDLAKA